MEGYPCLLSSGAPDRSCSLSGARSPSKSGTSDRCSRGSDGAPDTVRCTPDSPVHPAKSYPAKVLFDTGATHSFVSTSWVEAHNIPIEPMIPPLRVNSVGGKVQSDRICLNLRIEIRGIDFPANLVVMGTQGLDVILGMNWLH
jgi:hypothetical protein